MEKIKWISIASLFILLFVVILYNQRENETAPRENALELTVSSIIPDAYKANKPFIQKGVYTLPLDYVQQISGKADGWHFRFSEHSSGDGMFVIIDFADTNGLFKRTDFPVFFHTMSERYNLPVPAADLYRNKITIGYAKKISRTFTDEEFLLVDQFACRLNSIELKDETGSFDLQLTATHNPMLSEIFKGTYVCGIRVRLLNVQVLSRII